MKFKYFYALIFTGFILFHNSSNADACKKSFTPPAANLKGLNKAPDLDINRNSLSNFAQSMTQGLFLNENQKDLFQLYITQFFTLPRYTFHNVQKFFNILEEFKSLSFVKLPVREQILTFLNEEYAEKDDLHSFIKQFKSNALSKRNSLFRIRANWGFWAKMLSFSKPSKELLNSKEEKEQYKNNFFIYLNKLIDKKTRSFITDPKIDYRDKTIVLYEFLNKIRMNKIKQNQDVKLISRAMFNLVDTAGFGNRFYTSLLDSSRRIDNIEGLNRILSERDAIADTLGFKEGFKELAKTLNIKDHNSAKQFLEKYAAPDKRRGVKTAVFRLRPLSLQESPFRSCLSGDCATDVYFSAAMKNNFLYFTLTNKHHRSSGHIGVVLGKALDSKGNSLKTAFVDKIQNIPHYKIIPMLEGIRRSLEEQGYILGIPKKLGNHNGLSIRKTIRAYAASEILPHLKTVLKQFTPEKTSDSFSTGFSRAYDKLTMLKFEGWILDNTGATIYPGEIHTSTTAPELSIKDVYQNILLLKDSEKEDEQITFLNHLMNIIKIDQLNISKDSATKYLEAKIQDLKHSFRLRKQALFILVRIFMEQEKVKYIQSVPYKNSFSVITVLENWLKYFSTKERKIIFGEMSTWRNKPSGSYKLGFISLVYRLLFGGIKNVQYLLEHPDWSRILDVSSDIHMPLHYHAVQGNTAKAQLLQKYGADVNATAPYYIEHHHSYIHPGQTTPLTYAVRYGTLPDVRRVVLRLGADINARDGKGYTALMYAKAIRADDITAFLELHGAKITLKDRIIIFFGSRPF